MSNIFMIFGQDVAQLKIAMLLTPKKLINIVNNRSLIRIVKHVLTFDKWGLP